MSNLVDRVEIRKLKASYTSKKLDWFTALNFDEHLQPYDCKVAFAIMRHINAETGIGYCADETIALETRASIRSVIYSRNRLRGRGWLDWQRIWQGSKSINAYKLLFDKTARSLTVMKAVTAAARERRTKVQTSALASKTGGESAKSGTTKVQRIADIHLQDTPYREVNHSREARKNKRTEVVCDEYLPMWSDTALARIEHPLAYLVSIADPARRVAA